MVHVNQVISVDRKPLDSIRTVIILYIQNDVPLHSSQVRIYQPLQLNLFVSAQ
jgi:hypothetical protein